MSRIGTVVFQGAVTAAGTDSDLLYLLAATDKPIRLRGLKLGQISEVGDAAEEGLRLSIIRLPATVTVGSGGAAVTPQVVDPDDTVSFTARANDTTLATTSGTAAILEELAWNNRNSPYETWWPDPEFAPKAKPAQALVVRLQTTLADDMTALLTAYVEEL